MEPIHVDPLGPCCRCAQAVATRIVMIEKLAPVPDTGWGCRICIPRDETRPVRFDPKSGKRLQTNADGALSVLCTDCAAGLEGLSPEAQVRYVRRACYGLVGKHERIEVTRLKGKFQHNWNKHGGN